MAQSLPCAAAQCVQHLPRNRLGHPRGLAAQLLDQACGANQSAASQSPA
eukprot:CAMPEP_0172762938 /NCGR_PEP_ID=MMETSP1074-20121228/174442_1 /TAXON_ID=2916 /ORGANISM="Ceratium fusus, Strain PA161109" /LENGTH=48 /DNA_ID= /DNA_START= /DNA_END= /DNA_ORIENTATION=